ncbi:MAG: radical SAM protein [archaeon]
METKNEGFKVLFVYPNQQNVGVVPSNLAILSACLKEKGFQTKLFDTSIYKTKEETQDDLRAKLKHVLTSDVDKYIKYKHTDIYEDFERCVEEYKPNIIAVSVVDSTINFATSIVNKIKDKKIPTIFGGIGATFLPEKILGKGIDWVCRGEGEETLVEICTKMQNREDIKDVMNLCYKDENGKVIKNPLRPLVDVNELPMPDFSIYEDSRLYRPFRGKVLRMVQMDIDRGCPFTCTYCAAPNIRALNMEEKTGCYYRVKSTEKIIEEMKFLVEKYNLNFVWISSETFLAGGVKELQEFARKYKEEINLPFWCQTRIDTFVDTKVDVLYNMGCQAVSVGFEHGNEKIRNEILKKRITNQQIIDGLKVVSKYDIFVTVNSMIGLPDETREDIFETIEMNKKINKILKKNQSLNVFIFAPFSGTPLRQKCIEKGYIDPEQENLFSFYEGSILNMPTIGKEEIKGLAKTIPFYIKLSEEYYPQIRIAEKEDEEGIAMFNKLSEIHDKV